MPRPQNRMRKRELLNLLRRKMAAGYQPFPRCHLMTARCNERFRYRFLPDSAIHLHGGMKSGLSAPFKWPK